MQFDRFLLLALSATSACSLPVSGRWSQLGNPYMQFDRFFRSERSWTRGVVVGTAARSRCGSSGGPLGKGVVASVDFSLATATVARFVEGIRSRVNVPFSIAPLGGVTV